MLFNSAAFLAFFVGFYAVYLMVRRHKTKRNIWLLAASAVFYGAWDWRFLSLLAISTVVDFSIGRALARTEEAHLRLRWVRLSLLVNLGILGFFKYFGFFADSLGQLLATVGWTLDPITLDVVLPVGISFYTFQTLSYTVDVYRRHIRASESLLDFAVFVSFFPQLVAGPIERAARFLPQVQRVLPLSPADIEHGIVLFAWGLFKKVVLADRAASIANAAFNDPAQHAGINLALGALAFTLQIYGDFSGYSDMARGLARLLGFDLMVNFKLPYFARNPSDFWERWHISLSSWLRDYLYIPLGGNRGSPSNMYRNLLLTMLLGGLWHGARWNFVLWGAFHGVLLIVYRLWPTSPAPQADSLRHFTVPLRQTATMFGWTVIGWVLFRVESIDHLQTFVRHLGSETTPETPIWLLKLILLWTPLLLVQWAQHRSGNLMVMSQKNGLSSGLFVAGCVVGVLLLGVHEQVEFLYFQF